MSAQIFCFANQKGGVAKTTTAVNLGAYLAAAGRRVLIVDIDPQCNATTSLGINPHTLNVSLYDVLVDGRPIQEALTLTGVAQPGPGAVQHGPGGRRRRVWQA